MSGSPPEPIRHLLREAARAEPPADLLDRIAAEVRTTPQSRPWPIRRVALAVAAVAVVVATIVLGVALRPGGVGTQASSQMKTDSPTSPALRSTDGRPPARYAGQPVYVGDAIGQHIASDRSNAPFLVGGWLTDIEADCIAPPSGRPTSPLAPWCPSGWFLTETRYRAGDGSGSAPLHLIVGENVSGSGWGMASPVILRVHAHDAEAASCAEAIHAECDGAVVVDALVWSGAATVAPTQSATPSPVPLPSVGGTCTSSQLVPGTTTSAYGFSTVVSRKVEVTQSVRNAGPGCELAVPTMIGVAPAAGSFVPIGVNNVGNEVCVQGTCHYVAPPTYEIGSGQSLSIDLDASWLLSLVDENALPGSTPPPCPGRIQDVTRVAFPLAAGSLEIDFETAWQVVCSSDLISLSVTVAK
jgi:hypothetical protein